MPSTDRLAAIGLAFAALTIVALALMVFNDLAREAELHREVLAGQTAKDSLSSLRTELDAIHFAARLAALGESAEAVQMIERRAVEIDAELNYLTQRAAGEPMLPEFDQLASAARLFVMHARSLPATRSSRGAGAALAAARAAEPAAESAQAQLAISLAALSARINDRTLAQIRIGESLRQYVAWLLAGSIAVLVGLFEVYRRVQARERDSRQRIEYLAHFDPLTRLPNRTLINDRLEQETARARRTQRGFALLLFDLDGFKAVNDTWGHAAGDRLLEIAAERARQCMRLSDTVGRLGGDEFLAILPETSREGALAVAEKLRKALAEPYLLGKHTARLSVSVGMSLYPQHGAEAQRLQSAADAALYEAKRAGKNRTVIATAALARNESLVVAADRSA